VRAWTIGPLSYRFVTVAGPLAGALTVRRGDTPGLTIASGPVR